jgi:hypothetical protein
VIKLSTFLCGRRVVKDFCPYSQYFTQYYILYLRVQRAMPNDVTFIALHVIDNDVLRVLCTSKCACFRYTYFRKWKKSRKTWGKNISEQFVISIHFTQLSRRSSAWNIYNARGLNICNLLRLARNGDLIAIHHSTDRGIVIGELHRNYSDREIAFTRRV